ncbi:MAG: hypothetical protein M1834_000587 [Cirrosporium novae-zelandiae]|nr:MAG: hypothetical protein M1834_000587 [Cirrosporium novae-zelandiae]
MTTSEPCDHVDLLIIGAGPAGLMSALWASRLNIKTRIIDKRGTKIFNGQADGLQCRSLEIFDSFGFADKNPDAEGIIRRTGRIPDTIPNISRFQEVVLHQGRIERFILDSIKDYSDIEVERGVLPETLDFDSSLASDHSAYPITVQIRHLSDEEATPAQNLTSLPDGLFRSNIAEDDTDELIRKNREKNVPGTTETIRAKYMVGCDGAHSWTRRQLRFQMEGEQTDFIWGVLDIIPITDFRRVPTDIRMRCAIHSAENGSLMVIPREKKLVRLYIQLTEVAKEGGRVDRSKITPQTILEAARKILSPYKLEYNYCDWWTAYQIGQRVGDRFSASDRIFLAGDAVHTHSPKAGQGMNVSMQDAYNLVWKIGLVSRGIAKPRILQTYESERRRIAQDLIAFDHRFSRLFSGRPAKDAADEAGISMAEFKDVFEKGHWFASGLSINYDASILVAKAESPEHQNDNDNDNDNDNNPNLLSNQSLATNLTPGTRFPNAQVLNQSDARPWPLQHLLKSTGQFHLLVFAGNLSSSHQLSLLQSLGESLTTTSPLSRHLNPQIKTPTINLLTIHSAPRTSIELSTLHPIFHPFDEVNGWDYESVFVDDVSYHEGFGDAYGVFGIGREKGCFVVVRPDGYVGFVGEMGERGLKGVEKYFRGVFV